MCHAKCYIVVESERVYNRYGKRGFEMTESTGAVTDERKATEDTSQRALSTAAIHTVRIVLRDSNDEVDGCYDGRRGITQQATRAKRQQAMEKGSVKP